MSFFFSSRRRHTRFKCDWSSDVCSADLVCVRERERERVCVCVCPNMTMVFFLEVFRQCMCLYELLSKPMHTIAFKLFSPPGYVCVCVCVCVSVCARERE